MWILYVALTCSADRTLVIDRMFDAFEHRTGRTRIVGDDIVRFEAHMPWYGRWIKRGLHLRVELSEWIPSRCGFHGVITRESAKASRGCMTPGTRLGCAKTVLANKLLDWGYSEYIEREG